MGALKGDKMKVKVHMDYRRQLTNDELKIKKSDY